MLWSVNAGCPSRACTSETCIPTYTTVDSTLNTLVSVSFLRAAFRFGFAARRASFSTLGRSISHNLHFLCGGQYSRKYKSTEGERQETHLLMISSCVYDRVHFLRRLVYVDDVVHGSSEILRKKIQFGDLISTESQCWLYNQANDVTRRSITELGAPS